MEQGVFKVVRGETTGPQMVRDQKNFGKHCPMAILPKFFCAPNYVLPRKFFIKNIMITEVLTS